MYKRLAYQQGDLFDPSGDITKTGNVRFAEIEFSANARLCRTLGIKKLPNVHLYKGTVGRVAGFPCGPNKFPILQDNIDRFLTMSDDDLTLEKKLEEGGELADQIVTELQQEHLQALQEGEDASL
jgi:thioredoxin-like negative regulator of GroEL